MNASLGRIMTKKRRRKNYDSSDSIDTSNNSDNIKSSDRSVFFVILQKSGQKKNSQEIFSCKIFVVQICSCPEQL